MAGIGLLMNAPNVFQTTNNEVDHNLWGVYQGLMH